MFFVKLKCVFLILISVIATRSEEQCGLLAPGSPNTAVPWQAAVYKNGRMPVNRKRLIEWVCSATLISNKVVLTVAHKMFIRLNKIRPVPAASYSAAVGTQPWPWKEPEDISTQYSQVIAIHLAPGFQHSGGGGGIEYYADDIAIVIVEKAFTFTDHIRPVCLNFEYDFQEKLSSNGALGKTSGWLYDYYDEEDEKPDYYQMVKELRHVPLSECLDDDVTDALDVTTVKLLALAVSDKLCFAASQNISAPCTYEEEDGGGVAFPAVVDGVERYYLRGVFSGPLESSKDCTVLTSYMYTPLLRHESFVRKYVEVTAGNVPPQTSKCELPPYPEHGSYITNVSQVNMTGGKEYSLETLVVSCEPGYGVLGPSSVSCFNGFWLQSFPKCVRMCTLKPHPSVQYTCGSLGSCAGSLPPGTLVEARCTAPHYHSPAPLPLMACSEDGYWDYVARCVPDCGRVTPEGIELVVGGLPAKMGELPWHVGVYKRTYAPYMQVCGGSLISNNLVISAAHCFWSDVEKQLPAEHFAIAAGKLYRPWNDKADKYCQRSNVAEIHLPPRFQGSGSNFQDDVAVVEVATPFEYRPHIRPVCLNFDANFQSLQLQVNNMGKVAGWGLTSANGAPSPVLQVAELPYVDVGTCIVESPPNFREYITSDKICAGNSHTGETQTALCKGDSGGGLAFPSLERGVERFFLRGVVSTAPNNEHACNTASYTSFTTIYNHQDFIKQFLTDQ